MQMEEESIPNCTSFECKNGMLSGGPNNQNEAVPENWGKQNIHWGVDIDPSIYGTKLNQVRSVPACNSLGCKTESLAKPDTDGVWRPANWGK